MGEHGSPRRSVSARLPRNFLNEICKILTDYSTPVIYLVLDRLRGFRGAAHPARARGSREQAPLCTCRIGFCLRCRLSSLSFYFCCEHFVDFAIRCGCRAYKSAKLPYCRY